MFFYGVTNVVTLRLQTLMNALPSRSAGDLPRKFGSYTLFEHVGQGGMAEIYLARAETELGATRLAVVKQILPAFAGDPRFAGMLIHEAKLAARLGHRHIVQVFDLGKHDEHLFIAMEYVEGFDLNALLRECSLQDVALPACHALGIVADVLEGLDYAHRRTREPEEVSARDRATPRELLGIVHRDVSPSNILISYEGEVKLCDFGIAHANDVMPDDASDTVKGKAGYMSPEHARGERLDARADVFAAGVILWELLAGRRLYKPKSEIPLLEQARAAVIPALPDKGVPMHAALEEIVLRALARRRDERYPSAGAMLRDLEAYLAESGLLASRLKLGEWMATTFGTARVDKRRESERRLPKSVPAPRPSERSLVAKLASEGASGTRASNFESGPRVALAHGSLEGAALSGVELSSAHVIESRAPSTSSVVELNPASLASPYVRTRPRFTRVTRPGAFALALGLALGFVALVRVLVH